MSAVLRLRPWVWMLLVLLPLLAGAQTRKFQPGDTFYLACAQEPTLNVMRRVQADGGVDLPILGRLDIVGLSQDELASLIASKIGLGRESITVTRVAGTSRGVSFSGAVKVSGEVPCSPGLKLSDLAKICSPSESADLEAVQILSDKGTLYLGNLSKADGDLELRSGDSVFFPMASTPAVINVVGGVQKPGVVTYRSGMLLRDAIELAGGITNHGDSRAVKITRNGKGFATIDLASDVNPELLRGDTVQVPLTTSQKYVSVAGFVKSPGLVEFRPGMTLEEAIKAAGGALPSAALDRIEIKQILMAHQPVRRVNLSKAPKTKLNENDAIVVPKKVTVSKTEKPKEVGKRRVVPPLSI